MAIQNKFYKFKVSQIDIKNNLISWESHTLPLSGISRFWAGSLPKIPFPSGTALILLFLALSGRGIEYMPVMLAILAVGTAVWIFRCRPGNAERWINIELASGEIYSISTGSDVFIDQFFDALKESYEGVNPAGREMNFNTDGKIVDAVRKEPAIQVPVKEFSGIVGMTGQDTKTSRLVSELQKLYQCYRKRTDADSEILDLINDAARLIEADDREGLQALFKKFVLAGLINDCNDLGLDSLITEIRNSVY